LKDSDSLLRPRSENRRRPLTSRESGKSRNISSHFGHERRYSECQNMSFNNFTQFLEKQKELRRSIQLIREEELNSGVIVGRKICIGQ